MSLRPSAIKRINDQIAAAAADTAGEPEEWSIFDCCWADPKQCKEQATHRHKMFGELCPKHAAVVMRFYPRDKVNRL